MPAVFRGLSSDLEAAGDAACLFQAGGARLRRGLPTVSPPHAAAGERHCEPLNDDSRVWFGGGGERSWSIGDGHNLANSGGTPTASKEKYTAVQKRECAVQRRRALFRWRGVLLCLATSTRRKFSSRNFHPFSTHIKPTLLPPHQSSPQNPQRIPHHTPLALKPNKNTSSPTPPANAQSPHSTAPTHRSIAQPSPRHHLFFATAILSCRPTTAPTTGSRR